MKILLAFQLAWRNLWRNYRRSLIMLAAIVLGCWSMIFMTTLARGSVDQMIQVGLKALPGHIQVHNPEFRADPTVLNTIPPPNQEMMGAITGPGTEGWTTRIRVPAVITSERETRGVTLVGINPEQERNLSFVADDLADGRYLESSEDKGLLVGKKMLERLETNLGKRVVLMSQDPENEIVEKGFRVVGVFDSELEAHEEAFVFAGETVVQKLLNLGNRTSELAVVGPGYRETDELLQRMEVAAATYGEKLEVKPWYELDTMLGGMFKMMDAFILIFVLIIFLVLSFGLVNTLVMAVFERTREIGLMLALGVSPKNIVAQVMAESILLLTGGLVLGNALAIATNRALKNGIDLSMFAEGMADFGMTSVLYPILERNDLILANIIVLVLGFIASISPAIRAARLEPVQALSEV